MLDTLASRAYQILAISLLLLCATDATKAEELNIATVNNADMLTMQSLSRHFLERNPGITLNWEIVDESVLRLMQSRDSKREVPRYDIYTLGLLEAPLWGANGRLDPVPSELLPTSAQSDWIAQTLDGFASDGQYYALPFYGESSITYYRRDVLERHGLSLSDTPTWQELEQVLARLRQRSDGRAGHLCLRGKGGWGENMALFSTLVNAFGGRWFDADWRVALTEPAWREAVAFYLEIMVRYGPDNAWERGYQENLAAFAAGECDIWVDSTAAGGSLAETPFYDDIGYAQAPGAVTRRGANWLWAWGFAVPASSSEQAAAWRFIRWATSDTYHQLVAENHGIAQVPPGTRQSLYDNPEYQSYAHFSDATIDAIEDTDFDNPSIQPVPYKGVQFVRVEEFQQMGDYVGDRIAGMLRARLNGEAVDIDASLSQAADFVRAAHNVADYLRENDIDAF